jgi:hypothetical protein
MLVCKILFIIISLKLTEPILFYQKIHMIGLDENYDHLLLLSTILTLSATIGKPEIFNAKSKEKLMDPQ